MFRRKKEESISTKKSLVWGTILFFAFTVLSVVIFYEIMFDLDENFVALENTSGVQKDDYVSLEVSNVLDKYYTTTNYVAFVKTSVEEHYVVLLENGDVVPIVVSDKKMRNNLDEMRNKVQAGEIITEPIIVKGLVHTFDPEVERAYSAHLERMVINDDTNRIYRCEVDGTLTGFKAWGMVLLFAAFDAICILGLIKTVKKEKSKLPTDRVDTETPKYNSASVNKPDDVFTRAENGVKER